MDSTGLNQRLEALEREVAALRQREERLQIYLNLSSDLSIIYDEDGRAIEIAGRSQLIYGGDSEAQVGKTLHEVFPRATADLFFDSIQKALVLGSPQLLEYILPVGGKEHTFQGQIIPLDQEQNGRKLVMWIVRDLTAEKQLEAERLRSETALSQSQARLAGIIESAMDAIITIDDEQCIVVFNRAAEAMFRCPAAQAIGSRLERFIPERFREAHRRHIEVFAATGTTDRRMGALGDLSGLRSDGEEFPIEAAISQIRQGPHRYLTVILRAITERKQAEEREKHLTAVLRAIRNINQLIVHEKDRDRLLQSACSYLTNTRGYHTAWIALVDEAGALLTMVSSHLDTHFLQLNQRLKSGEWVFCAKQVLAQPHTLVITDALATCGDCPLVNAAEDSGRMSVRLEYEGRVAGVLTVSAPMEYVVNSEEHDLLEEIAGDLAFALHHIDLEHKRLQVEAEIHRLNAELEERVRERTGQLVALNKELEAFNYSVSHDLRTPLRALDGFSQAILEDYADRLDDQGKRYLERIRLASQRMSRLIDDLLALSYISRQEMNRTSVSLSALAREIADDLRESAPDRNARIIIHDGLSAQGDKSLLRIALQNLLGNAWKFSSREPAALIELGMAPQPDKSDVYFIKDNGVGFDMTYMDKLFGAFQRLHAATEFEGTGIGLAIVQRIIHRHGGRIWAESAIDQGTTFYFTLSG